MGAEVSAIVASLYQKFNPKPVLVKKHCTVYSEGNSKCKRFATDWFSFWSRIILK